MDPRFAVHMWDIVINEQRYTPRPGDLVMDLGAWVGHFSLYCASRGASVIAYEPVPEYFSIMKHAVEKEPCGGYVDLRNRAVWSSTGKQRIYPGLGGDSSFFDAGNGGLWFEVQTDSLVDALGDRYFDCVSAILKEPSMRFLAALLVMFWKGFVI